MATGTALRSNQDIIKGSKLMVFMNATAGATTAVPVGFATNHSLSVTTNTATVSTKDSGDYPSTIAQNISWEVSCENLYSDKGEGLYMRAQQSMSPVHLVFAEASNYSNATAQPGLPLIDSTGATGVTTSEWQYVQGGTANTVLAEGDALVTSLNVNAPAGDNATLSVTFTGTGQLQTYYID